MVSLLFFPCIKLQTLGEHRCLSKSRKIGRGRNLLHIPFIHISLLTGVVKTSQMLLYSRVAAEKALISRMVTFALRCAYLFIVFQSREQLNQTHSKIPSPRYMNKVEFGSLLHFK